MRVQSNAGRVFTLHYKNIPTPKVSSPRRPLERVQKRVRDCLIFLRCFLFIFFFSERNAKRIVCFPESREVAYDMQFKNTFRNGIGFRTKKKHLHSTRLGCHNIHCI